MIFEQDDRVPLLHLTLLFEGGTTEDPTGKEGTTRLMLRLLRRTAGGRSAKDNEALLDRLGASLTAEAGRLGVALSGTTIARSTGDFLSFIQEAVLRPGLLSDEFERSRRETIAEVIDALDSDSGLARTFFRKHYYGEHPFGRATLGTPASLERITQGDIRDAYARLVGTSSLTIAFAGASDATTLRAFDGALRSALPPASSAKPLPPEPAIASGRRLVFVDKPERTQTQILIGTPGAHPRDPDHTALFLANTIFGGTFTARLSQEVRVKRGWSYGADSSLPIERIRQPLSLWTFPASQDAAACIQLQIGMLEQLVERGVTKSELARAQRFLEKSHVFSIDTASKRANLALDTVAYDLPADFYSGYLDRVRSVTKDDVDQAIRSRIDPSRLLVLVVGTAKDIEDGVAKAIPELAARTVTPYDARD